MTLPIKMLRLGDAKLPDVHYAHDAGLDLYSLEEVTIAPSERVLVGTGIAMAIPQGYAGLVWDKSGHANKRGLKTLGGVVDAGYRGEIKVGLINLSQESVILPKHEPVAQMLIQKVEQVSVVEVDSLDDTERGSRGFDSRAN